MTTTHLFATNVVEDEPCQICPRFEKTFEFLGKKWNGLIISVLCENNELRFKDLAKAIAKCSDRVLVERLKELESAGIIDRHSESEGHQVSYALTEKGRALLPVMDAVHAWADQWEI
ncbi:MULTISPECIES: winged helix-turn-helix transcriptional regulator [Lapidilactobacillus]|uniref:Winged helix-turn-helix transcriptional regulator n=1 Tax=Lapidilactobacillus achengensis TaxID=2486000 RepID=A0ABW1UPY7_9LACO|nr:MULTISPECIES: helix-turn-helix domain-containing protein [Lapidilactobacillus]